MEAWSSAKKEAKHRFIDTLAVRLGARELLRGGENAPCRLYVNVPIRHVGINGIPLHCVAGDVGNSVIDLLICSAKTHRAVLGVIFKQSSWQGWQETEPFLTHLGEMEHLILRPEKTQSAAYIAELEERICRRLRSALDNTETAAKNTRRFSLHTLPMENMTREMGETIDELRRRFIQSRLLFEDEAITPYGRVCGVLEQYETDDSGKCFKTLAVAGAEVAHIKESLRWSRNVISGKPFLANRLNRLYHTMPSDDLYGMHQATVLNQLLESRLEEICAEDLAALSELTDKLAIAGAMLKASGEKAALTYADALRTVRDLYRKYQNESSADDALRSLGEEILVFLAKQLLGPSRELRKKEDAQSQSLEERLLEIQARPGNEARVPDDMTPEQYWYRILLKGCRSKEYPILTAPLSHYFYAASVLDRSDYPIWFYHAYRLSGEDPRQGNRTSLYMAYMLKWALGEIPGCEEERSVSLLYDLLVEPIFPGMEQIQ